MRAEEENGMKRRPSRWFYLLGLLPAFGGFIGMGAIVALLLTSIDNAMDQIVAPGVRELQLEPGLHTVFWEPRSVVDGRLYAATEISGLMVRVQTVGGQPVAVRPTTVASTYSMAGREGQSINEFQIDQAGLYRVSADYGGEAGPETVIAVGNDFMGQLIVPILAGFAVAFGGVLSSLVVLMKIYRARRRTLQGVSAKTI